MEFEESLKRKQVLRMKRQKQEEKEKKERREKTEQPQKLYGLRDTNKTLPKHTSMSFYEYCLKQAKFQDEHKKKETEKLEEEREKERF